MLAALPLIALTASSGAAFGWAYFALLRRWVARYIGQGPAFGTVLSALARIAAAVAFFTVVAHWGLPSLLAAFLGFLLARTCLVRTARAAP